MIWSCNRNYDIIDIGNLRYRMAMISWSTSTWFYHDIIIANITGYQLWYSLWCWPRYHSQPTCYVRWQIKQFWTRIWPVESWRIQRPAPVTVWRRSRSWLPTPVSLSAIIESDRLRLSRQHVQDWWWRPIVVAPLRDEVWPFFVVWQWRCLATRWRHSPSPVR
jgi:hypothetical protein